jgi:hypothetical protein
LGVVRFFGMVAIERLEREYRGLISPQLWTNTHIKFGHCKENMKDRVSALFFKTKNMKTPITLTRPDGTPINKWEMWTRPKKDYHWQLGRSAMELAKSWFHESIISAPEELLQLLNTSDRLAGLHLLRGIPECVTKLPERGEGRNHDLWLLGQTNREQVTICIEAKADEPFGHETVAEYRLLANQRRDSGESTRVPERIIQLLSLVPGDHSLWENIRYQLLTGICGTAIQAQRDGSVVAVFVVHEFHTFKTTPDNILVNTKDFNTFVAAITGISAPVVAGTLYGPIVVGSVECMIGKTVRRID